MAGFGDIGAFLPVVGSAFAGASQQDTLDNLAKKQQAQADSITLARPSLSRTQGGLEGEQLARANASTPNDAIYSLGQNQINQQEAARNRAITTSGASGSDILSNIIKSDRETRDASVGNLSDAYRRQFSNRQDLYDQLGKKSAEELNIFDYNQNQPYQNDYLKKQNLIDASQRNQINGGQAFLQGATDTGNNIATIAAPLIGKYATGESKGINLGSLFKRKPALGSQVSGFPETTENLA